MIEDIKLGFRVLPKATRTILSINIVVFLITLIFSNFIYKWFGYIAEFQPTFFQPWRIVTYSFVHALSNPFHIVFNMLLLWWVGKPLEETIGTKSFCAVYFFSAIGGAFLQTIFSNFYGTVNVIGASGAVNGIFVAFAYLYPNVTFFLFGLFPVKAKYLAAFYVLMDMLFLSSGDNVAHLVHLGGAATAIGLMYSRQNGHDFGMIFENMTRTFRFEKKTVKNPKIRKVDDAKVVNDVDQKEIDRILDKISKTGYNGLTDEEKKTLFELSKKS